MMTFTPEEGKEIRERECFDERNIRDEFKNKTTEEIKSMMKTNDLIVVCSNRIRDFNWSTVVRNANAFGVSKVLFTGKRRYDRRGTVGAHHYTFVDYHPDIFDSIESLRNDGYRIVAAEYDERFEMKNLYDYTWSPKTALIFGEEGVSIDDDILTLCDDIVMIPMYGTVRSVNVGTASGIFMSHFACQNTPT